MNNYQKHLKEQYSDLTFKRKIDYFKYNFSSLINTIAKKSGSVLEIGPGMGECIAYLNNKNITNIDVVDNDRQILEKIKDDYKVNKSYLNSDLLLLTNKLGKYDLIILIQVLEHLPLANVPKIIRLLYSHLNKNGEVVVVVPNAGNPLGLVERYGDLQHQIAFTEQSLKDLINESGIANFKLSLEGYNIPPTNVVNIIRIMLQKILHLILLLIMIINGGTYFKIMTPNITLRVKKS
jgi:2-polyprenyl-3-methyl-5-hydroxy-6-metoxy-1,4-benzoquinol methylase